MCCFVVAAASNSRDFEGTSRLDGAATSSVMGGSMRSCLIVSVLNKSASADMFCPNCSMRSTRSFNCAASCCSICWLWRNWGAHAVDLLVQLRGKLLLNLLVVEELGAHAVDLRAQLSNMVFVVVLYFGLAINQAGEDAIAKREIGAGCNQRNCRDYERGPDSRSA